MVSASVDCEPSAVTPSGAVPLFGTTVSTGTGGESVTGGESQPYVRFSVEAAVARAPQVIVLADHSAGTSSTAGRPAPEQWQRFSSVPAIRAGRLHSVDLSILHRYGPSVVEGLESLARVIHPEAFR